jgi:hypothetical protein
MPPPPLLLLVMMIVVEKLSILMDVLLMIGWLMNVEQLVDYGLAGETEVFKENLPNSTLSTTNPTVTTSCILELSNKM